MEDTLSVRIVTVDWTVHAIDPDNRVPLPWSGDRRLAPTRSPEIRVFGSAAGARQPVCLHIHGFYPYLLIDVDDIDQGAPDLDLLCSCLHDAMSASATTPPVIYSAELVKRRPVYGYCRRMRSMARISLTDPSSMKAVAALLRSGTLFNGHRFLVQHAHVPYTLQFFIEHLLYGMDWLHLRRADCRYRDGVDLPGGTLSPIARVASEKILEIDVDADSILNPYDAVPEGLTVPSLASVWKDLGLSSQLHEQELTARVDHYAPSGPEAAARARLQALLQEAASLEAPPGSQPLSLSQMALSQAASVDVNDGEVLPPQEPVDSDEDLLTAMNRNKFGGGNATSEDEAVESDLGDMIAGDQPSGLSQLEQACNEIDRKDRRRSLRVEPRIDGVRMDRSGRYPQYRFRLSSPPVESGKPYRWLTEAYVLDHWPHLISEFNAHNNQGADTEMHVADADVDEPADEGRLETDDHEVKEADVDVEELPEDDHVPEMPCSVSGSQVSGDAGIILAQRPFFSDSSHRDRELAELHRSGRLPSDVVDELFPVNGRNAIPMPGRFMQPRDDPPAAPDIVRSGRKGVAVAAGHIDSSGRKVFAAANNVVSQFGSQGSSSAAAEVQQASPTSLPSSEPHALSHVVQNVVVACIETLLSCRGTLEPAPEYDPVIAIVIRIERDDGGRVPAVVLVNRESLSDVGAPIHVPLQVGYDPSAVRLVEVPTEADLLDRFVAEIRDIDPDFIVAYEIQKQSLGYLDERWSALKRPTPLLHEISRVALAKPRAAFNDEW